MKEKLNKYKKELSDLDGKFEKHYKKMKTLKSSNKDLKEWSQLVNMESQYEHNKKIIDKLNDLEEKLFTAGSFTSVQDLKEYDDILKEYDDTLKEYNDSSSIIRTSILNDCSNSNKRTPELIKCFLEFFRNLTPVILFATVAVSLADRSHIFDSWKLCLLFCFLILLSLLIYVSNAVYLLSQLELLVSEKKLIAKSKKTLGILIIGTFMIIIIVSIAVLFHIMKGGLK